MVLDLELALFFTFFVVFSKFLLKIRENINNMLKISETVALRFFFSISTHRFISRGCIKSAHLHSFAWELSLIHI